MMDMGGREVPRAWHFARREGGRFLTRRAFAALGGIAALSLFLGSRLAWGGVGSGAWGSYGGTASPGAHFGYDAGWAYSYDGTVWMSASCNCTVGRMTELFLEIGVDAYVACNGAWNPTWSPDMPDTPTYAYIREDTGAWLTSRYWIIDTTYDHDWYAYMVGASLRIPRREDDWRCWCGADIKGLGGNAPGTHTIAEAPQWIPRHVLTNDGSWEGHVVTLRPRAAGHLRADAVAGGVGDGTAVVGWSETDATNQNWIVLSSAQGRTCFVPVHTGDSPRFLDVDGGVWDDGARLQIWSGNGSLAQSYYLHSLGNGYHLIVSECSGCALDLFGGGQAEGTHIVQWNCLGNWNNKNQNWKIEEPEFHERVPGIMKVTGKGVAGGTLVAPDPSDACLPRNYPETSGMLYRYAWYRGAIQGMCSEVARRADEQRSYVIGENDEGTYLTCVVTAHTRYRDIKYRGEVMLPSVFVRSSHVNVRYFADGEVDPCFEERVEIGTFHMVPEGAWGAAVKASCTAFDGWYVDSAGTNRYLGGATGGENFDLHGFNLVELAYGLTDRSLSLIGGRMCFLDEALTLPFIESDVLPSASRHRFGDHIIYARGRTVWFEDMGCAREMPCALGAFADASASGAIMRTGRLTSNATVYLDWGILAYDGIAFS